MPELPEVETIRRQISKKAPFRVLEMKTSRFVSSICKKKEFDPVGKRVSKLNRKGKALEFEFGKDSYLISHLGMTGAWLISKDPISLKHTHLQFECKSSKEKWFLAYNDPRRFGKIHFLKTASRKKHLDRIGIDISSDLFTADYLFDVIKKRPKRQLKPLLLDQSLFAGVGNYIANEMCARAGILPSRRCRRVSFEDCQKLVKIVPDILWGSLEGKGVTFHGGYKDTSGEAGQGLQHLVVFWQKICRMCGVSPVRKIVLAQRGTFYCPSCQK